MRVILCTLSVVTYGSSSSLVAAAVIIVLLLFPRVSWACSVSLQQASVDAGPCRYIPRPLGGYATNCASPVSSSGGRQSLARCLI
jgi:hypothetical protein